MAERSFAREVEDLKLGDGEVFRGEGILAVTKALLQSGVAYVGGYQGSPISHLMDVFTDAKDVLRELGVHFETSAIEAAAAAMLAASVNYPLRGAVDLEIDVGTNVGVGRAFQCGVRRRQGRRSDHRRRGLWRRLLDHAGAHPCLCHEIADLAAGSATEPADHGATWSKKASSCRKRPTRPSCWSCASAPAMCRASFVAKDNRAARRSRFREALDNPDARHRPHRAAAGRFLHEKEKIETRWPAAHRVH